MAKDPICGMTVKEETGLEFDYQGQTYYFCSDFCRNLFEKNPDKFVVLIRPCVAPGTEKERSIAYFSMEIALDPRIPTYSGGLGILAGDTLKSCADLKVPAVAVTLLYEEGYFYQKLDEQGNQYELPVQWNPRDYLRLLPEKFEVQIEGRSVGVRAWPYDIVGITGCSLPIIFLDTDLKENSDYDRGLSHYLYDTALNIAIEAIDRLKVTGSSRQRAFLVEVMGRDCGYLALMAGIAGGAEAVVIPEVETDPEMLGLKAPTTMPKGWYATSRKTVNDRALNCVPRFLAICKEEVPQQSSTGSWLPGWVLQQLPACHEANMECW